MSFLSIFKNVLKKGITIGWSTGKPFDPRNQERTDAIDDMVKAEEKRLKKKEKK